MEKKMTLIILAKTKSFFLKIYSIRFDKANTELFKMKCVEIITYLNVSSTVLQMNMNKSV
jgi:hypothetical protein